MRRNEMPFLIVGAVGLVAVAVLSGTGHVVPAPLWAAVSAVLAGALGIANPTGSSTAVEDVVDAVMHTLHNGLADVEASVSAAVARGMAPQTPPVAPVTPVAPVAPVAAVRS